MCYHHQATSFSNSNVRETSYDHLDIECLRQLYGRCPKIQFLVPLGVKGIIVDELKIEEGQINALDWWDDVSFPVGPAVEVEFVCTPAQHNSGKSIQFREGCLILSIFGHVGRSLADQRKTLWASWVVRQCPSFEDNVSHPASIYFAG